ncbi:MAG: thiolase family protein [Actinobacteria bacterium]|nr:thiolase family protein [Actinomycetota bacterium]MBU1945034.1 thiolase family protein [Actinomycetota bacterium]MBU2686630.1 thiolase family protein [Actinomycetota bacterium]
MDRRVAVVGYAQTEHRPRIDSSREMMVYRVTRELLDSAGVTKDRVDTVVSAQNDFLEGRTISNMRTVGPLAAFMKEETKVEMDGAYAALYAYARVRSGLHDVALVAGESMASCYPAYLPAVWALDPTFDRPNGFLNELSAGALQARSYMERYGVSEEQVAGVSVKNLGSAAGNPKACRSIPGIDLAAVMGSRALYSPLRELNCYPLTDGACALLLAEEKTALEMTDRPVWIQGVGSSSDTYYLGERNLSGCDSLAAAADAAYRMAGISDPRAEIDVAEVHESFSHEELIFYEALGLCGEGEGAGLLESGATSPDGDLPVNPSGGALGANPLCATGLIRIVESAMQIRGDAGDHQVPGEVATALAQGQNGLCAQQNVVFILRGQR